MAERGGPSRSRAVELSWVAVSLLGVVLLIVPLYDIWDDVSNLSWSLTATLAENALLVLLALGLVRGGVWLSRQDWETEYVWTVTKWNLGAAAGIGGLYALVIALQLAVMGDLKPWVLAFDGILIGSVVAFGAGIYNARQRMANDALAESRERYQTLTDDVLDSSDVATFILDDDFRVVWLNEATAEYFDLDRDEVVGMDKREVVEEHVAPAVADPERFRDRVFASYDDNTYVDEFECRVRSGEDREGRWLEHWSQPIESGLYAGGRLEQYTDVTQIKEREAELDLRERKLREFQTVISDEDATFDEQVEGLLAIGRDVLDVELAAFSRVDQDTAEYHIEAVQAEDADLESGDTVPLAQTHCEEMLREERTVQFETRPFDGDPTEDGTDVGFERYVGTPVYEHDNVYGTLCFLDRTEGEPFDDWQLTMVELLGNWLGYELSRETLLERHQQRLRNQTAKLREFVDSVDNYAIFALDEEGRVASWNEGAQKIKGYTEDEIVGKHIQTFYPDEKVAEGLPAKLLTEAWETGKARHRGWRVRKDGSKFWADVTIAARYDAQGNHVGYTKVTEDLTDQRAHERTLERERERLEFVNRILRHNILNGLNLVYARTNLLLDRYGDDEDARDHLVTIRDRASDLSSLIDTMRSFMDAIVGDDRHENYPVAIRDRLTEKVELAAETYDEAVFETHDLPAADAKVVADELVGEVFENLLSNAVIHNDKDTPRVEIWSSRSTCEVQVDPDTGDVVPWQTAERPDVTTASRERPAITVHIADNGPGIPDDEKQAVLEKGVSELSEPGNGFGLYLVKEMMQTYGGRADIRDNDADPGGDGTVFELTFPRPADD